MLVLVKVLSTGMSFFYVARKLWEMSMEGHKTRSHIADSVSLELTLEVSRALLKYYFISGKAQTYSTGHFLLIFEQKNTPN